MRVKRAALISAVLGITTQCVVACSADKPQGAVSSSSGVPSSSSGGPTLDAASSDADADAGVLPDADATADAPLGNTCLGDDPVQAGGFPTCPDSGDCAPYCNDIVAHYRLGLAQVAVACLSKLSSCADTVDVNLCVDKALDRACKDTSSVGYCSPLVTPCDPNAGGPSSLIDELGCETFGNGLSPSGRDVLATCIQAKISAGTCPSDVRLCTDAIRQ